MEKPIVSVVTITRNRGKLLKRCITSVLAQTYENIEHIVVDGASDDNTDEVIASFNDSRLKYYKLDYNWPFKDTQTYAFEKCQGKYITFLDSDDEYLPTKIEKQVALIESLPEDYGFVYCWMTYYDASKNNQLEYVHSATLRGFVGDEVVGEPLLTGTPTLMFRMSFWRNFEGWKSRDEIGISSDWEMCCRACQLCKVDYVPESLVNVYVNHGSIRQSDITAYYKNTRNQQIKFHIYFLNSFAEVFKRRPDLLAYHYFGLFANYAGLGKYGLAIKYLLKSFGSNSKFTVKKLLNKHDKGN